jgi:CheY-like chemotaxis protein
MKKARQLLFVDDEAGFLSVIKELLEAMAGGAWKIFTAETHAQALALLQAERMDVVVLDIGMPVMDGFQFLRLLGRAHPGQQVVMLTGNATEERRKTCVENGAVLLLEKPTSTDGYQSVFAALNTLAEAHPQAGFRGMMCQVGLPEVLQMECLGRKSSVLEVFTSKLRGQIYICDGAIVHAESGALQGEVALYGLLALQDGEFNLQPFKEPVRRTIAGPWEFLLMEAARLVDEETKFLAAGAVPDSKLQESAPAQMDTPSYIFQPEAANDSEVPLEPLVPGMALDSVSGQIRIEEIALCSGAGEVLYEWKCQPLEGRLRLLEQVEQQASQLSGLAPVGRFDRLEITTGEGRLVCLVQTDRRLFVRSSREKLEEK